MSGGSFNYMYSRIEDTYAGFLEDKEMNEMLKDFIEVLHDLEWWKSCDSSEESYRETVNKFKAKWFAKDKLNETGNKNA